MKKLFSIFVMCLLILSAVSAYSPPPVPAPVSGVVTFKGNPLSFAQVVVTNQETGDILNLETGAKGSFLFDLSYFEQGYFVAFRGIPGDTINIKVGGIDVLSFEIVDTMPKKFTIELGEDQIITYVCWDGTTVLNAEDCPEQPTTYVCWDGSTVTDQNDCPGLPDTPTPEEPTEITKVTTNEDKSVASVEAFYGDTIKIVILDNKLVKLQDKEIDFDGDDYDIHEEIRLTSFIRTSLDDVDYLLNPYLVIPEEGIEYRYVFDDALPKNEIDYDETLEINLLGKDVEIVKLTDSSMTILYGEKIDFEDGETKQGIKILGISSDSVLLEHNGESAEIYEDEIVEVGGIQIQVISAFENEQGDGKDIATLRIAEDIELFIENGDDYNDEDTWKWIITSDYIGITNQNEYEDLEEDYTPFKESEGIALPNDFAQIDFKEVTTSDLTELDIRVKDEYLHIRGDREDSFADEHDEIFVDENGIYDEDKELIDLDKVRIGESNIYLELGSVKIGKLTIELDMSDIKYNGVSFADDDDNYLDYLGIIFKDIEKAIDDKDNLEVIVPDERPEVTISISSDVTIEPDVEPDDTEPDTTEPDEPDIKPTEPTIPEPIPTEPEPKPRDIEEPVVEPDEEDEEGYTLVIAIIGILIIGLGVLFTWNRVRFRWAPGMAGIMRYNLGKFKTAINKGDKEEADKLKKTLLKYSATITKKYLENYLENKEEKG